MLLESAQNLCSTISDPFQKIKTLAIFVSDSLGGRTLHSTHSELRLDSLYQKHIQLLCFNNSNNNNSILSFGKLRYGTQ
jgi:hypothetical protein